MESYFTVGVITSWPPFISGLSEYSKQLYKSMATLMPSIKINIYAYKPTVNIKCYNSQSEQNIRIKYIWDNKSPRYPLKILRSIIKDKVHLVHVQHEYWLYGRGVRALLLLVLLILLRSNMRKIILTLHGLVPITIYAQTFKKYHKLPLPLTLIRLLALIYINLLCKFVHAVIVHLNIMKKVLVDQYGVDSRKIHVIMHGVPSINEEKYVKQNEKFTFLVFGSIRPDKGIDQVLKAFNKLKKKYNNIKLVIAGSYNTQISPESLGYLDYIHNLINNMNGDVKLLLNIPSEQIPKLFQKSHVVILNYLDSNVLAASGPLSLSVAYTKPVIATKVPRFLEYKNYIIMVTPGSIDQLVNSMEYLIKNKNLYSNLKMRLAVLRGKYNWYNIAKRHLNLYIKVLGT